MGKKFVKASATTNTPYKKDEALYDPAASLKGKAKAHTPAALVGTSKPESTQHRLKTASVNGFCAGFVDMLQFVGLSKEAAVDVLQKTGGFEEIVKNYPYASLGAAALGGAGLGAGGLAAIQRMMKPKDVSPDLSSYGQPMMSPQMGQPMMEDYSGMEDYFDMGYDPYAEMPMDLDYGQNMMVPGAWYSY